MAVQNNIPMLVDLYKNTNSDSKYYGKYYGRIFPRNGLTLKGFAKHLAEHGKLASYEMLVLVQGGHRERTSRLHRSLPHRPAHQGHPHQLPARRGRRRGGQAHQEGTAEAGHLPDERLRRREAQDRRRQGRHLPGANAHQPDRHQERTGRSGALMVTQITQMSQIV